jgi:peptidoglycan hydrolase-like protein with peptidoglycan-binding domain
MKTVLCLALVGAVMAGPAFARGMQQQSGETQNQPSQMQQQQQRMSMDQETIREVQQKLSQQGYNIAVDGRMGPNTRQALRQFQMDQGISGSGQLNEQTMAALGVETGMQQAQTPEQAPTPEQGRMPQQQPGQSGTQEESPSYPPSGGMSR